MEEKDICQKIFDAENQHLKKGWLKVNTQNKQTISIRQLQKLIKYVFKKNKQKLQLQIDDEDMDIIQIIQGYLIQKGNQSKSQFTLQEALNVMNWSFQQEEQSDKQQINNSKLINQPQKQEESIQKQGNKNQQIIDQPNFENNSQKLTKKQSAQQNQQNNSPIQKLTPQFQQNQQSNHILLDGNLVQQLQQQEEQQKIKYNAKNNSQNQDNERQLKQSRSKYKNNTLTCEIQKQSLKNDFIIVEQQNNRIKNIQKSYNNKKPPVVMPKRIQLQVKFYSNKSKDEVKISKPKIHKLKKIKPKEKKQLSPTQCFKPIFQFYCLINNQFSHNKTTFDQIQNNRKIMSLHKFMLFCKDYKLLNYNKKNQSPNKLISNHYQITNSKPQLQNIQQQKIDNFPIKQVIDAQQQKKKKLQQQIHLRNQIKLKQYQQKSNQKVQKSVEIRQKQNFLKNMDKPILNKSKLSSIYKKCTNFLQQMSFLMFLEALSIICAIKEQFIQNQQVQLQQDISDELKNSQAQNNHQQKHLFDLAVLLSLQTQQKMIQNIKNLKILYKKQQKQVVNLKKQAASKTKTVQINGKFRQNIENQLIQYKRNRQNNKQNLKEKYLQKYQQNHIKMPSLHSSKIKQTSKDKYKQLVVNNVLKQAKIHLSQNIPNHFGNSRVKQQGQNKSFVLRKKAVTSHHQKETINHYDKTVRNLNYHKTTNSKENHTIYGVSQNNQKNINIGYKKLIEIQNQTQHIEFQQEQMLKIDGSSRIKQNQVSQKSQYLQKMGITIDEDQVLQQYFKQQSIADIKLKK